MLAGGSTAIFAYAPFALGMLAYMIAKSTYAILIRMLFGYVGATI